MDARSPSEAAAPLDAVLAALCRTGGLCVFDLDSTLLDNRPRQARILREFGESRGDAGLLAVRPEHFDGWDLEVAMRNAGVPAERALALRDPARRFWRERFFTSEYCRYDVPVLGAVDFVRAAGEDGEIVYLTGRHEGMRAGTVASLQAAGFPLPAAGEVHLLLKPTADQHDDAWKDQACAQVLALGRVVAAFDNEPAHINRYQQTFAGALCVHLDTDHSGRPIPLAPGIPSIRSFAR